jgi:protein SCO1
MRALIATLVVALIGGAVLWHATDGARAITAEGARRLYASEKKPLMLAVDLRDMSAATVPLEAPPGGVALVEFVYTSCPTICRSAGEAFWQLKQKLTAENLTHKAKLFSVSFDPEHDDREALAEYARNHRADGRIWNVAAPVAADLPRLLESYKVTVISDEFGGFEHNVAIHLIDDQGRLRGIFDIDDVPSVIEAVRKWR